MSNRVTITQITALVQGMTKTARLMGFIGDETVQIQKGSVTYGNSWAVDLVDADTGERRSFPGLDLHGNYTARQAWNSIHSAYRMLTAVDTWNLTK